MSTKIIARNSLWSGLETGTGFISSLLTSIAIARVLGPDKLGPFVYIVWLSNVAASLGGLGIPAATAKYMAEFIGRSEQGIARAIFFFTLRLQILLSLSLTVVGLIVVHLAVDPSNRGFAVLLTVSILPAMINFVPTQANVAAEDLASNVPGGLASTLVYTTGVVLSLVFGWGLIGLAGTMVLMRLVELIIRMIPALRRVYAFPVGVVPPEVRRKLLTYSRQNVILLLLAAVVWDRSEILFLRYFSSVRQLAFYSVVFNITERLRVAPQIFGSALTPTILAQYGRDPRRLNSIVSTAVRYLGFVVLPVNLGIAVLAPPFIRLLYGSRYEEAIPFMAIAALLAVPKALLGPLTTLLGATENQHVVVRWTIGVAILNLSLDLWLIPRHAAMGAVIANGVSQTVITAILFFHAAKLLNLQTPFLPLAKTAFSALVMAAVVLPIAIGVRSPIMAVSIGVAAGASVFFAMLRITGSLETQDRIRFRQISERMPALVRPWLNRTVDLLVPAAHYVA